VVEFTLSVTNLRVLEAMTDSPSPPLDRLIDRNECGRATRPSHSIDILSLQDAGGIARVYEMTVANSKLDSHSAAVSVGVKEQGDCQYSPRAFRVLCNHRC
jgi:hypothetical protein